jgi:hypothetical protein
MLNSVNVTTIPCKSAANFVAPSPWIHYPLRQIVNQSEAAMIRRPTILLSCVMVALAGSTTAFAAANECDRACLRTSLDQYLTAVAKHNPSAAPLFAGFRQTENAVVVPLGSGVWKSVTGLVCSIRTV